jgi:hypothetical protein
VTEFSESLPATWATHDPEDKSFILDVPEAAKDGVQRLEVRYDEGSNNITVTVSKGAGEESA